jgi:adenine deaminase
MPKAKSSGIQSRFELTRVALGESEADIALINGKIVNVYSGELISGETVLLKGDRIAYAGKYAKRGIGPKTLIIDASGKILVPGFIDGHTHMDYICSSYETVRYAMKTGTTTVITETAEITFSLGYAGIIEYLKSIQEQPIKFWFTLPPMGTISPIARKQALTLSQVNRLLKRKDCVGLGEVYWRPVNTGDRYQLAMIDATIKAGKKVEGHSAGATANKLQGYAALGISSDHEPIAEDDTLERLRLGLTVMLREGEVRKDLEATSKIKDHKIDFRHLSVATDGIGPWQFTTQGFMDHLVQKAIDLGFPPIQAIQMATLNVAEHFNLDEDIGGIAPGRFADIVIIPDLNHIKAELVISNGKVVSQNGEIKSEPRRHRYPEFAMKSVNLNHEFSEKDFSVITVSRESSISVRVIDQLSNVLTQEKIYELKANNGQIEMDVSRDILKIAAIERMHAPGKTFNGFIHGLGLKKGAIATSTCWDSAMIAVAGANESDMAAAVNRIKELGGGTVICVDEIIISELAFPIGGLISDEPSEALAEKLTDIQETSQKLGCISPDIRTTLSVLATPAIPYLRMCESGLYDVRSNKMVELVVEKQGQSIEINE